MLRWEKHPKNALFSHYSEYSELSDNLKTPNSTKNVAYRGGSWHNVVVICRIKSKGNTYSTPHNKSYVPPKVMHYLTKVMSTLLDNNHLFHVDKQSSII